MTQLFCASLGEMKEKAQLKVEAGVLVASPSGGGPRIMGTWLLHPVSQEPWRPPV